MPFADVNGQRLFFEDSGGDGPAVLLSHGFLMDSTMFDPQVEALAPEFRCIRWDERAFGRTEFDGKPFTYWDSAADAIGLLDHLGIESAVLGGMSQGGFLSMRAALAHPDRVRALVLIDTQSGGEDAAVLDGYRAMTADWLANGPVNVGPIVANLIIGDPAHEPSWQAKWETLPRENMTPAGDCLFDRDDITDRLGEITCPALVIHGTADQAIPMEKAELLCERLPDCRGFVKVEGAAHAANLTHPEVVNPPLLDFLRSVR
ncbi:MAG TPA: alpha/beta hydrolase [Acidimicrobiales bacterium]|nr:alpha/beta hydrolase [Acidimicrobiales bacterium]